MFKKKNTYFSTPVTKLIKDLSTWPFLLFYYPHKILIYYFLFQKLQEPFPSFSAKFRLAKCFPCGLVSRLTLLRSGSVPYGHGFHFISRFILGGWGFRRQGAAADELASMQIDDHSMGLSVSWSLPSTRLSSGAELGLLCSNSFHVQIVWNFN